MDEKRDVAIVLRSIPYEERHRIVTALTEYHGQISGLARNAIQSRRFGGCLEPFAASDWQFVVKPGAELVRIEQAQIRRAFDGIRKDFERLSMASVFSELMLRLAPKHEAAPDLFKLHSNALALLEERTEPGAELMVLNAYLAKLLQWNGSQPRLVACMTCSKSITEIDPRSHVSCVIVDAGWVCAQCRTSQTKHIERGGAVFQHSLMRITPVALHDFQVSLSMPIRQALSETHGTREQHEDLFRFLEGLFVYHVPGFDQKPLKALKFLGVQSPFHA